jgi:hypothetical protein
MVALRARCLFVAVAAAGCIRTQRLPPPSYEGMSIGGFAQSLGWEVDDHADTFLLAISVRMTPWPEYFDYVGARERGLSGHDAILEDFQRSQAQGALAQFGRWCGERGGQQAADGVQSRFAATVREWADSYVRRNKYKPKPGSGVCTARGGAILAAYVNINNVEIAFYDGASARAFMDSFGMAVALTEGHERAIASAEEESAARDDPHPDQEASRARLVKQLAAAIDPSIPGRLGARFEYIGHCRIRLSSADPPAVISLRHLDHTLLTNVGWIDLDALGTRTPFGVIYHIALFERDIGADHRMATNDLGVAQQVVHGFEDLGRSCGAW